MNISKSKHVTVMERYQVPRRPNKPTKITRRVSRYRDRKTVARLHSIITVMQSHVTSYSMWFADWRYLLLGHRQGDDLEKKP